MIEVEIKAKVQDLKVVKEKLKELKAEFICIEKQADYIFGRAKDLDKEHKIIEGYFSARIREKDDKKHVEFKEIKREGVSMEFSAPLASLKSGFNFLGKLDFEKAFNISKIREIYKYKDFEISLDDVEQLGFFVEVEHPNKKDDDKTKDLRECKDLLDVIAPNAVVENKKYGDLMQELINNKL